MINMMMLLCLFFQIKEIKPHNKWEIEIVTKKRQEYVLLTKDVPLTFTVEGPTYLRVYTRIFWPANNKGKEVYKIILQENEIDEKILTFESELSTTTKDVRGTPLSKWRSFYVDVPEGLNTYRLLHWSSPRDTMLLRFSYESPKEWKDIPATEYNSVLETIEEEKVIKYYTTDKEKHVTLGIQGPVKLKVTSRLNFDATMMGEQVYTILVKNRNKQDAHKLRGYKSEIIEYRNRNDLIPSNAQSIYIPLKAGWHNLSFSLSGTIGNSAALRFQVEK